MKQRYTLKAVLCAALVCQMISGTAYAGTVDDNRLAVNVRGIRNKNGLVTVTLCTKAEVFPSGCARVQSEKAAKGVTVVRFDDIEAGTYAVAIFHDENADGQLTFFQEGIGFSNDSNKALGPPQFAPASFEVAGSTEIDVNIRYFN